MSTAVCFILLLHFFILPFKFDYIPFFPSSSSLTVVLLGVAGVRML